MNSSKLQEMIANFARMTQIWLSEAEKNLPPKMYQHFAEYILYSYSKALENCVSGTTLFLDGNTREWQRDALDVLAAYELMKEE